MPTYLFTIGVATGSMTAGAACQILLFVVYGIEMILEKGVLPVLYSLVLLVFLEWNLGGGKAVPFIEFLENGNRLGIKGGAGDYYGIQYFSVPSYPCSGFGTENRAAKSDICPAGGGRCGRQRDRADFGERSGNQGRDWGISPAGTYGASVSASFKDCP